MKKKALLILSLIIIGCKGPEKKSESGLTGVYYSVAPSRNETISIMYAKGYFNFVYKRPNEDCLELKENHLFTHHVNYCKVGNIGYDGKWSVDDNTVIIDYFDSTMTDLKFTIIEDKIYTIRDFKTTVDNERKTMKSLLLLKKQ